MNSLLTTGRGYVNTWQCDENAHLNVQFFTSFAYDATQHLLAILGFGPLERAEAGLGIVVAEDHVRYYRELLAADSVEVCSAPIDVSETGEVSDSRLVVYHEIRNAYDGALAATVRSILSCVTATGGTASLPEPVRDVAAEKSIPLPDVGRPRSAGGVEPPASLNLSAAPGLGLIEVVRNTVGAHECGADGRLLPRYMVGRNSDGAGYLWHQVGFDRTEMRERNQGTVVMEMRQKFTPGLKAGDLAVLTSGLVGHTDKVLHFIHLLFDGETGELAAFSEAAAGLFDLEQRALAPFDDPVISRLKRHIVKIGG